MLTTSQRDIVAGLITYACVERVDGLSIEDIVTMYELNRKSVEEIDISRTEGGLDE